MNKCAWHICEELSKSKFCSKQCKNKFYVSKRRKRVKLKAIEYMGGKCIVCGYNRCVSALAFHHIDESKKEFGIASYGYSRSWDRVKAELNKCVLLCSNCHAEHHEGMPILSQASKEEGAETIITSSHVDDGIVQTTNH